jgi:hypothetical protein
MNGQAWHVDLAGPDHGRLALVSTPSYLFHWSKQLQVHLVAWAPSLGSAHPLLAEMHLRSQWLLTGLKFHAIEGLMYLAPACTLWLYAGAAVMEFPEVCS